MVTSKEQIRAMLEEHAQSCLVRLQEVKAIQAEYNQACKALRVFEGAQPVARKAPGVGRAAELANAAAAREVVAGYLKRKKNGATAPELIKAIHAAGHRATQATLNNVLDRLQKLGVVEVIKVGRGTPNTYQLKG